MNIAFVFDADADYWDDGLRAAIELIDSKDLVNVFWFHVGSFHFSYDDIDEFDFVLTWGAFSSPQAKAIAKLDVPKGICVAGGGANYSEVHDYDVIFVETEWQKDQFREAGTDPKIAFGINEGIFYEFNDGPRPIDYLYPAAFAKWKRHEKFLEKPGLKVAVGYMQPNGHEKECWQMCLKDRETVVLPRIKPEKLAWFYNQAKNVYIPSTTLGGGERTLFEAKSCGCKIEVEEDNEKLTQMQYNMPLNHHDYAESLLKGIKECVS